jgi:hypothetical protein
MLAGFGSEAAVVAAAVERGCHRVVIVQPSGQPISRSHSTGVRSAHRRQRLSPRCPRLGLPVAVGAVAGTGADIGDEGVDVLVVSLAGGSDDRASDVNARDELLGSSSPASTPVGGCRRQREPTERTSAAPSAPEGSCERGRRR